MALRIFIVDDSDRGRAAIKSLLSSESSKWLVCGEAVDGDDAVARATEAMSDVILLDLSLPQVHGMVLAARLRNAVPSAAIVIMSAQAPRFMRQFADPLPGEHFVSKSNLGTDLVANLGGHLLQEARLGLMLLNELQGVMPWRPTLIFSRDHG
jgi:DNA-binding NarL/FixJ family response regulator